VSWRVRAVEGALRPGRSAPSRFTPGDAGPLAWRSTGGSPARLLADAPARKLGGGRPPSPAWQLLATGSGP